MRLSRVRHLPSQPLFSLRTVRSGTKVGIALVVAGIASERGRIGTASRATVHMREANHHRMKGEL